MKVLFRFDCSQWLLERLATLETSDIRVSACGERDDAAYHPLLRDADILWHVLRPVTRDDIDAAPKLRLIQKIGVGTNTIDLDAARSRGIAVCNMPGSNSRAVAELALGLMLACLRRIVPFDGAVKGGSGWSWPTDWQGDLSELGGKTVGLAGFGSVARLLAPMLEAMGANVIYSSRGLKPCLAYEYVSKQELLSRSDVLSLHMPLTPETENWLDRASIGMLKPGAVVVNVARGGLIDEAALEDALRSHSVRAAGLDVFRSEPVAAESRLVALPNVVALPHVAWLTRETIDRSLAIALENTRRMATGHPLLHRVA